MSGDGDGDGTDREEDVIWKRQPEQVNSRVWRDQWKDLC